MHDGAHTYLVTLLFRNMRLLRFRAGFTLQSELSRENYFLFTMNRLGKLFSINYDSISSSPVC